MIKLGVVADDFTGASDVASFLVEAGVPTVLCSGIPERIPEGYSAAVIALKSRTQPVKEAVQDSLCALETLRQAGAEKFYIKYCSTFDSTPEGNIGPVVDAAMDWLGVSCTVLDPALPINGRTVKDGRLFVFGTPLDESPMKDHPLTPMWDSRISELMRRQGRGTAVALNLQDMQDADKISALQKKKHVYVVPDHVCDEDADVIIRAFGDLPLLTGGSALAGAWGRHFADAVDCAPDAVSGRCLLLAGSCSTATRCQIEAWRASGRETIHLDPSSLLQDESKTLNAILQRIAKEDCLVYTSDDPNGVADAQASCRCIGSLIEQALAKLAVCAKDMGVTRWIVAGGETSGAVTRALGYSAFAIGRCIAPGVPVLTPADAPAFRLVLKSGNFGQEDFFLRAWERTNGND